MRTIDFMPAVTVVKNKGINHSSLKNCMTSIERWYLTVKKKSKL